VTFDAAFQAPYDSPDPRADVEAQIAEWMRNEPKVIRWSVTSLEPSTRMQGPDWWTATLEIDTSDGDNLTLGLDG
jgi:hypothetical protein